MPRACYIFLIMKYKMLTNSGTRGAVTGRNRCWKPGQVIDAPVGEFAHLAPSEFEVMSAETATAGPAGETAADEPSEETVTAQPAGEVRTLDITDGAMQLATEKGITDLSGVTGTGTGGRITKKDIEAL
jgi:pyruvate/2-oxoglutarate dehydrogenase complex dihydrolipoamide acyltransferase (E2) component